MGVRGAALATILSQAVSCVWVLRFLTRQKNVSAEMRRGHLRPEPKLLLPVRGPGRLAPSSCRPRESVINVVLQLLPAAIRRGHGRGGHDHPLQRHAVRHAAPPGPRPGGPAHHQLQLRRAEQRRGSGRPSALLLKTCLDLLRAALGAGHRALPPALRRASSTPTLVRLYRREPCGSTAPCSSSSASSWPAR